MAIHVRIYMCVVGMCVCVCVSVYVQVWFIWRRRPSTLSIWVYICACVFCTEERTNILHCTYFSICVLYACMSVSMCFRVYVPVYGHVCYMWRSRPSTCSVCVYVCACVLHMEERTNFFPCIYVYLYDTCTCVWVCVCLYVHVCYDMEEQAKTLQCTYVCLYLCVCVCVCVFVSMNQYICVNICICVRFEILWSRIIWKKNQDSERTQDVLYSLHDLILVSVCMCVCACVCICISVSSDKKPLKNWNILCGLRRLQVCR